MKNFIRLVLICLLCLMVPGVNLHAETDQKAEEKEKKEIILKDTRVDPSRIVITEPFFMDDYRTHLRYATLIGIPAIYIYYGIDHWNWGENDNWRWAHERWFQYNTHHGGADKVGHVHSHYMLMRGLYGIFDYTEEGRSTKWLYSILLTGFIGTMIEVGDAFTDTYGFSTEDLICDFAGIAAGALFEASPFLDNFFAFTWEYVPSRGFQKYKRAGQDFTQDYSGSKWLLSLKLSGFKWLGWKIPEFLRYITLDCGYYTRAYEVYDRNIGIPESEKSRYLFYGISFNFVEIAGDLYENRNSRMSRITQFPFKLYHPPVGYQNSYALDK